MALLPATALLVFILKIAYSTAYPTFDYCKDSNGWIKFNGACYSFQSKNRMSYYDAEDYCRTQGAQLASIHSADENEFILNTLSQGRFGGRLWIGLDIFDGEDKPRWSDESPVTFDKRIKKEFYKNEKCFIMYTSQSIFGVPVGGWRPEHCALHYTPICKRPENAQPTAIPPPTTVAPPAGHCPKDWIQFGQQCYRYFGAEEKDRAQYKEARNQCWSIGKDCNLVSVHSMEEQAFLTQHLSEFGTSVWIGLNQVESDEVGHDLVFGWVDNTRNDFDFWAKGHPPRGTWKNCARLSYEGVNKGEWIADYCEVSKQGYICQRPSNPNLPPPTPEPSKCAEGFKGYRNSCYRLQTEPVAIGEAEEKCKDLGGHLLSVVDSFEQAFIFNYVVKESKPIGIGLQTVEGTRYLRWTDKQPLYYTSWEEEQPQLTTTSKSCVVMDTSNSLKWKVTDCSQKVPYVCKMTKDIPPTFPEVIGKCPTDDASWIDVGNDFCYHVANSSNHILSWDAVSRYCMTRGMKMISVHSDHEMNSLLAYFIRESWNVHLGLLRSADKKSFLWADGSSLDYINWADREPSSWSSEKDCVAFSPRNGKWTPISCSEGGVTVCRSDKVDKN